MAPSTKSKSSTSSAKSAAKKPEKKAAPKAAAKAAPAKTAKATVRRESAETRSENRGVDRGELPADDPAFTNVFLNVGRRDGLRTEDVQRLLADKAGLAEGDIGHIRLRDRITFVGIRREQCERAIKALVGTPVGERTLNAEPARDR